MKTWNVAWSIAKRYSKWADVPGLQEIVYGKKTG